MLIVKDKYGSNCQAPNADYLFTVTKFREILTCILRNTVIDKVLRKPTKENHFSQAKIKKQVEPLEAQIDGNKSNNFGSK